MGDATGPHLPDATIAPEPGARTERAPDASMELLNSIQRETIDPEYAAVASEGLGRSRAPVLVIVIGLLAGWLAERFTRSNHGLLTNLVLGVVGAVAFGWVVRHFGFFPHGWLDNIVGGTIGAVVLISLYRQFRR